MRASADALLPGQRGEKAGGCPAQLFYGRGPLPLRERAEWGEAARQAGYSSYPVRRHDLPGRPEVTVAISDVAAARQLLARHDGRSAGVYKEKPNSGPINKLLAHSLTYASPEHWHRQRQAVKMAVGSTVATAATFRAHTACCSAEFGHELRSIAAGASTDPQAVTVDLREPIYRAACRLLCGIVLGTDSMAMEAADVLYRMKRTYGEAKMASGREAKRRASETADWAAQLETIVRSAAAREYSTLIPTVEAEADDLSRRSVPTAVPLIRRLANAANPHSSRRKEASSDNAKPQQCSHTTPPLLNLDEVVSNVHSFLLAGFETTAVLVLFSLLHLAHNQTAQTECATEAAVQSGGGTGGLVDAALKETLRLYPPVLSLPRLVAGAAVSELDQSNGPTAVQMVVPPMETDAPGGRSQCPASSAPLHLRPGQQITICTAAAARAGWDRPDFWESRRFYKPRSPGGDRSSSSDGDDHNDIDTSDDEGEGEMIPFGVGPRACPAGSLSLLLARELTNAALNAVELRPPPGRPTDGLLPSFDGDAPTSGHGPPKTGRRREVEYYWEEHIRALPVLALTAPADVLIRLRQAPR